MVDNMVIQNKSRRYTTKSQEKNRSNRKIKKKLEIFVEDDEAQMITQPIQQTSKSGKE